MNETALAVENVRGDVGKAVQFGHAVGHVAQKHRHIVVGIRLRIAARARTEQNDALKPVTVYFG